MSTLTQASHQWTSRPSDERFISLIAMKGHFETIRSQSREVIVPSRRLFAQPMIDNKGLELVNGQNGAYAYAPTHWSFGQLSQLAEAPAGYLRTLPSPIAADCVNYGLQFKRSIEDVGLLLHRDGESTVKACTGPRYGRIWNAEILQTLIHRLGDGINGEWRVPGEFGKRVTITKENTTLYAGDRDMFVFLADEDHRIEIPNRRNGEPGLLSRGFFLWNSEVGAATFGLATFLFDYVCCNRIVWGAAEYKEVRIRHTVSAPDRFIEEMQPALVAYANSSARTVTEAIEKARQARVEKVDEFLATRFGKRLVEPIKILHQAEEGRPIETLWDVTTAITSYAKRIPWQDQRVAMETEAGDLLTLAAK